MAEEVWWRVRCLVGFHNWFYFCRGRICDNCGKRVIFERGDR